MKQIVDKLNKIAKAIDENVELSDRDLIIDSLDSITKAFGGTPNDSNLIVDKLEDIAGVATKGGSGDEPTEVVYIPPQTVTLTPMGGGAPFNAGLLVDVMLDPENPLDTLPVVINGTEYILTYTETMDGAGYIIQNPPLMIMYSPSEQSWTVMTTIGDDEITIYSIVETPHDIPTMEITFIAGNAPADVDAPIKKWGYYLSGISLKGNQTKKEEVLIAKEYDEDDGFAYVVFIKSNIGFSNESTGTNCTIDIDNTPDTKTLLIMITDISQPASAEIYLLGNIS